jgi:hypothetical protein
MKIGLNPLQFRNELILLHITCTNIRQKEGLNWKEKQKVEERKMETKGY